VEKKIEKKRFSNGQHVKEKNSQKIMYDQNQVMNMLEEKIWMDNGHCLSFLVLKWERERVCVCVSKWKLSWTANEEATFWFPNCE